jgi:hypothetical protein
LSATLHSAGEYDHAEQTEIKFNPTSHRTSIQSETEARRHAIVGGAAAELERARASVSALVGADEKLARAERIELWKRAAGDFTKAANLYDQHIAAFNGDSLKLPEKMRAEAAKARATQQKLQLQKGQ